MFRLQTPWTPIPASPLSILHKHTMSRTKCLWPEQAQARFSHAQFNLTAEVLKHKILQNHHVRGNSKHVLGYFYRRDRVTLLCAAQPPQFSHQGFLGYTSLCSATTSLFPPRFFILPSPKHRCHMWHTFILPGVV